MSLSSIYKQYLNGDPITDPELEHALWRIQGVEGVLDELGERFIFAQRGVREFRQELETFKRNRKQHGSTD